MDIWDTTVTIEASAKEYNLDAVCHNNKPHIDLIKRVGGLKEVVYHDSHLVFPHMIMEV
ncbi:hypothetical protein [Wolbachia endosymbiont of Ctenocephalides felis wCfeT]|uniref:hypothetical protein n=1 Tax=Wolbachia endosymbiont of Ctenocephalides felis wCfeT TaxID=2732593 RepID=UPI0014483635|nr:hypothetical protein [Wolbachia endosymbiont of Ctenocephalides felis wCfeT]